MMIEFDNIGFHYETLGEQPARPHLQEISFNFRSDERIGIVGASGAGKTTLIQLLTALEKPTTGQIRIDGADINDKSYPIDALRQRIGVVFQFPETQLFEHSVAADIAFGPRNLGIEEAEIDRRVREAMRMLRLPYEHFAGRDIYHLSQGEKRRVAIAGILAMSPELLVLDEPTAGLDTELAAIFQEHLQALHEQEGKGLLIVSHDMDFLARVVDRIVALEAGRLVCDFPVRELAANQAALPPSIALPRAFRLANKLRQRGFALPLGILTPEELIEALDE